MFKINNKKLTQSSKLWINRQTTDFYVKEAKKLGYRSRSAFKLLEINNKCKFLKNKTNIIDLGSSPGGWSQVISKVNKDGKNFSIDLLEMKSIININFLKGDFYNENIKRNIFDFFNKNKVNVILSDMAVNTSGNKDLDAIKTNNLALEVIEWSVNFFDTKCFLLIKYFSGKDENLLINSAKKNFVKIERIKPNSSRKESREIYLLCRDLKNV